MSRPNLTPRVVALNPPKLSSNNLLDLLIHLPCHKLGNFNVERRAKKGDKKLSSCPIFHPLASSPVTARQFFSTQFLGHLSSRLIKQWLRHRGRAQSSPTRRCRFEYCRMPSWDGWTLCMYSLVWLKSGLSERCCTLDYTPNRHLAVWL